LLEFLGRDFTGSVMSLTEFSQASGVDVKGDDRSMLPEGDCDGESHIAKPNDRDSFWRQGKESW
jgi:hypothetical protein